MPSVQKIAPEAFETMETIAETATITVKEKVHTFARLLFLFFDVTYWVLPVGAIVGGVLTLIGASVAANAALKVDARFADEIEQLYELRRIDIYELVGVSSKQLTWWTCAGLVVLFFINGLSIANGYWAGRKRILRRKSSYVNPKNDDTCVQCTFAVAGNLVFWMAIGFLYAASAAVLVVMAFMCLLEKYCTRVQPLYAMATSGLEFSQTTLAQTNATYQTVYSQYTHSVERSTSAYSELFSGSPSYQQKSLNYLVSPLPALAETSGNVFGIGQSSIDQASELLVKTNNFVEFLKVSCSIAHPLPPLLMDMYIGTVLALVGQIIVSKYHVRYYTIFYYETLMARV
jgi:hypothetical protein